ncbi:MAG TPA: HNH endonuclease signature motif containing protein [Candidatus Angelobacter sp.]|nr:HNH endonuclease signature motif containing protein [Candidatus Angelobacter sp.]
MNSNFIRQVWEQAVGRCEYCHLPSAFHPAPFQIDHVIARQHGGNTEPRNLALACIHCNRFKGPNIAGVDPESGEIVRLFHPRRDRWLEHFKWEGLELKGLTEIGRVTIALLRINDPEVVAVRKALQDEGIFRM